MRERERVGERGREGGREGERERGREREREREVDKDGTNTRVVCTRRCTPESKFVILLASPASTHTTDPAASLKKKNRYKYMCTFACVCLCVSVCLSVSVCVYIHITHTINIYLMRNL